MGFAAGWKTPGKRLTCAGMDGNPLGNEHARVEASHALHANKAIVVDMADEKADFVDVRGDRDPGASDRRGARSDCPARPPSLHRPVDRDEWRLPRGCGLRAKQCPASGLTRAGVPDRSSCRSLQHEAGHVSWHCIRGLAGIDKGSARWTLPLTSVCAWPGNYSPIRMMVWLPVDSPSLTVAVPTESTLTSLTPDCAASGVAGAKKSSQASPS